MEIQRGPREAAVCSKHHQTEKALDMCMVLVSTLPRAFQKRKAAPTHPLEEKIYAQDLQGAKRLSVHKGSRSQAEK